MENTHRNASTILAKSTFCPEPNIMQHWEGAVHALLWIPHLSLS